MERAAPTCIETGEMGNAIAVPQTGGGRLVPGMYDKTPSAGLNFG